MKHRVEIYETKYEPTPKQVRWGSTLFMIGLIGSGMNLFTPALYVASIACLGFSFVGFLMSSGMNASFRWFVDDNTPAASTAVDEGSHV